MEKGRDWILSGKLKYSPWEEYYFTTLSVSFYFPSLICPLYGGKKYMIWKFGNKHQLYAFYFGKQLALGEYVFSVCYAGL